MAKIGLDFGTHQTKVCIVDNSDRRNVRYIFHRFADLKGNEQMTLPSVVQVNEDRTLSYGYTDEKNAQIWNPPLPLDVPAKPSKPKLKQYCPPPPIEKPTRPSILDEKPPKRENVINDLSNLRDALLKKELSGGKSFKQQQAEAQILYQKQLEQWKIQCAEREKEIDKKNKLVVEENAKLEHLYNESLKSYTQKVSELRKPRPLIFKHFKQGVFSTGSHWNYEEEAILVSIWYLTYVFFTLDKKYGTQNLVVNMGTSSGVGDWDENKRKATQIILTVYDLIERVFNHDMQRFLSSTFDELKTLTKIVPFSTQAKEEAAICVFPEAIANLQPLAKRKAFAGGVNLLVDIGGGTVDISLFTAPHGANVEVFDYKSMPYGLNSVNDIGPQVHQNAVSRVAVEFTNKLENYAYSLHVPQSEVTKIVNKRNVVFTGGGSILRNLTCSYAGFTEVVRFKERFESLISTSNLEKDAINEIHVLSTALGLAMAPSSDDSIPMKKYEYLFSEVAKAYGKHSSHNAYNNYEHGLSDD